MPSIALLLAVLPLIHVADQVPKEEALDLIQKDSLPEGSTKEEALEAILTHLVPLRDTLKEKTVPELRRMVKDDFGISGHSKSKQDELVETLIRLDLEERSRLNTLQGEEEAKTAGARKLIKDASDAEKARLESEAAESTTEPPAEPEVPRTIERKKKVMKKIRARDIEAVEVLKQFHVPTIVTRGKEKTASAAPIAKSIYRGEMARHVYKIAEARDGKESGFLAEHIKVLEVAED